MVYSPQIVLLTHLTSPYQVEFFNAIARSGGCSLRVLYLYGQWPTRSWGQRKIDHDHLVLADEPEKYGTALPWVDAADLAVFNYYRHPFASRLMARRVRSGKPWCFWGERMGVTRWAWAGSFVRRWKLRALHRSAAPIWGIGQFAVDRYRQEFGERRRYVNLSYFSDLDRFQIGDRPAQGLHQPLTFLFSGALIARKGVDLLATAFARVAKEFPHTRLRILGDGPLRRPMEIELRDVASQVEFLGFKDWEELPAYYRQADVLCAPSRHDGWGLIVVEGLAAGLPVIGTDRTGAALDFVQSGSNGWLIPAGDAQELYSALRQAAQLNAAQWAGRSQAALQSVTRHTLADGVRKFLQAGAEAIELWR